MGAAPGGAWEPGGRQEDFQVDHQHKEVPEKDFKLKDLFEKKLLVTKKLNLS
jgi:hypothetical protein